MLTKTNGHRSNFDRQSGFTLIEVMVGVALTAILVLGLSALWAVVAENFFGLNVRQKAILSLNGEMERIVALHQFDAADQGIVDYDTVTIDGDSTRRIYQSTQTGGFMESTAANFDLGEVFVSGSGGSINDRNLIWLDKTKNLVGILSWKAENLDTGTPTLPATGRTFATVSGANNCQIQSCQLLVLYMRYPYRFNSITSVISPTAGSAGENTLDEIELQTIVGQRSQP